MNLLIVSSNSLSDRKDVLMEALQDSDQTPTKLITTTSVEKLISEVSKELRVPYYVTEEFDQTDSHAETNLQIIRSADYVIFLVDESDPLVEFYRELVFECMNNGRCFVAKYVKRNSALAKKYYVDSVKRKSEV